MDQEAQEKEKELFNKLCKEFGEYENELDREYRRTEGKKWQGGDVYEVMRESERKRLHAEVDVHNKKANKLKEQWWNNRGYNFRWTIEGKKFTLSKKE